MYKVLLNHQDMTPYCIGLPENTQAKEKLELFLLPKYEFTFQNVNNWIESLESSYYKDIKIQLIETRTGETLISGNIIDIKKNLNDVTISIGSENDKYKELANIGYWQAENPTKIIKDIADYFSIPVNEVYYRYTFERLKAYPVNFYPDNEITLIELINKIKQFTNLDIFIANNQLIIDLLDTDKPNKISITDSDIIAAERKERPKIYTNYAFKCLEFGDTVEFTDENTGNLFADSRTLYGNTPAESADGSQSSILQIPTKEIGQYYQEARLSYYAQAKLAFQIELPLSKYQTLSLADCIYWTSARFRHNGQFEIREITTDYLNGKLILSIQTNQDQELTYQVNTGFGITPFGEDFGD